MNILLVDDDMSHAELLNIYLQAHQHTLVHRADPREALPYLEEHQPDLILLDVNMPHMSGIDLCALIRARYDLPIIMLTERAELSDRVLGLELGADDYLAKPFEPLELISRIKAVTKRYRRSHSSDQGVGSSLTSGPCSTPDATVDVEHLLTVGDVELDTRRREARHRGESLLLSTIEWNTLHILMKSPGQVFSRDEISSLLRGVEVELVTRAVDVTISRLRTHLDDDAKSPRYIKTVWGAGYTFLPHT